MGCVVTKWVKRNTSKWFGYVERVHDYRVVNEIYKSKIKGNGVKGTQLASWEEKVREYIGERTQEYS